MLASPISGGIARLVDRGVIRARGADAATFLQGQLTNDVVGLDGSQTRLAAFCSAKGRMQASFVVVRPTADEVWLVCAQDLLAATLKRLSMFVLRAKCKLDDASAELLLWGLAGEAAAAADAGMAPWQRSEGADGAATIRLPDAGGSRRALRIAPADAIAPSGIDMPLGAWNALDVASGVVTIVADTVDRFVPQMVNYELVGGVDFKKGCYPGQEVVARSQYRGTLKRRTFLYAVDGLDGAQARPGQDVYRGGAAEEPVGTVANVSQAAGAQGDAGSVALVELRLAALDDDAGLRLGSAGGAMMRRLPLPYDVPAADASER